MKISFDNIRQTADLTPHLEEVRTKLETVLNLSNADDSYKRVTLLNNSLIRICLIAGLSLNVERKAEEVNKMSQEIVSIPAFSLSLILRLYSAP